MKHYVNTMGELIFESDKGILYHIICTGERKYFVDYNIDENGNTTTSIGEPYDEDEDYYEFYVCPYEATFDHYIGEPFENWSIETVEQIIREHEEKDNGTEILQ